MASTDANIDENEIRKKSRVMFCMNPFGVVVKRDKIARLYMF